MTVTARVAVERGVSSLRANWELVLVGWLRSLLTTALSVLGLLPPLWVLGIRDFAGAAANDSAAWNRWTTDAVQRILASPHELLWPLVGASLLTLLIWSIAFVLYCYLQAGILGTLTAADRQCPPGTSGAWELFRTFSPRALFGWGRRYVWRLFWLLNLLFVVYFVWALLFFTLVTLAAFAAERWGGAAGFGVGCGGTLPLLFGALVMVVGANLAQIAIANPDATVRSAVVRALEVLGKRLGTVILLLVLWTLATITLTIVVVVISVVLGLLTAGEPGLGMAIQVAMTLLQWLVGSMVTLTFMASLVPLMRPDRETAS